MAKANEKSESLDSDSTESYEMASDVAVSAVNDTYGVNITNVTAEDVGTHTDDAVDVGSEFTPEAQESVIVVAEPVVQEQAPITTPAPTEAEGAEEYDDLPF